MVKEVNQTTGDCHAVVPEARPCDHVDSQCRIHFIVHCTLFYRYHHDHGCGSKSRAQGVSFGHYLGSRIVRHYFTCRVSRFAFPLPHHDAHLHCPLASGRIHDGTYKRWKLRDGYFRIGSERYYDARMHAHDNVEVQVVP